MAIQSTQGDWKIYQDLDNLQIGVQGSKDPKSCDEYRRVCLVTQSDYEIPDYNEAQANAKLIIDAVNNTAGAGIDPNAVPGLLKALQDMLGVIVSLKMLGQFKGCEDDVNEEVIKSIHAIKAAEIK